MEKEQTKNQQEKNQQENQKKSQKLQWHPAFCSALRLELLEDAENLEFTDEFQLTEKPLQIDCTVVKVKRDCKIKNEIGKIFRKHNIFEYKSPKDELNIDTFYKAVAYACLYKVLPNHVDEIPAEEITITLIRDRKPVKLLGELEKSGYGYKKRSSRNLLCQWRDVPGADHSVIGTGCGYACTAQGTDRQAGGIVAAPVFIAGEYL